MVIGNMVKNLKKTGVLLILILAVCFSLFFACAKKPIESQAVTISGFEVKTEITVNQGDRVFIEYPRVTDSTGVTLIVSYMVSDSGGGAVTVSAGEFTAESGSDYNIRYTVTASDDRVYTKTTLVKVLVGTDFTLTAYYEKVVQRGDVIEIKPVCTAVGVNFRYYVNLKGSSDAIPVSGSSFTAVKAGLYNVRIIAESGLKAIEYAYSVIVREIMQEGEIESYDSTWNYIEALSGSRDYTAVTTSECGIYDRNGIASNFAKVSFSGDYLNLYISPRGDAAYYSSLALKGYTEAVMWVYLDADKEHGTQLNYYHSAAKAETLKPREWSAIKINLSHPYNNNTFTSLFEYYKSGMNFARIDNSVENPQGSESEITVYIADMYVVKNIAIEKNESFESNYFVGDTANFDDACKAAGISGLKVDCIILNEGGNRLYPDQNNNYIFNLRGIYTLKCFPRRKDLNAAFQFSVDVADVFETTGKNLVLERDGTLQINFADFEISFVSGEINPQITDYTVLDSNGASISHDGTSFSVNSDGFFEVTAKARYLRNGAYYYTYKTVFADVYSDNSGGRVAWFGKVLPENIEKYTVTREYANVIADSFFTENLNLGGREGNYIMLNNSSLPKPQSVSLQVLPLHSKAYYEALVRENELKRKNAYSLKYDIFVKGNTTDVDELMIMNFTHTEYRYYKTNVWHTLEIPLSVLLENWDVITSLNPPLSGANYYAAASLMHFEQLSSIGDVSLYIGNFSLTYEADTADATLNSGDAVLLGESNNLIQLYSAIIEGRKGKIKSVSVENNGEYVYLNGNIFQPYFSGSYNAIFCIQSDGAEKYVKKIIEVGGAALDKHDEYARLWGNNNYDLTALTDGTDGNDYQGYTFDYEIYRMLNGNEIKQDIEIDGGILNGYRLMPGEYKVVIFAVYPGGTGQFNKTICYNIYLSYDESEYPALFGGDLNDYAIVRNLDVYAGIPATVGGVGGREGNYILVNNQDTHQSWSLQLLPLHSKTYYQTLEDENDLEGREGYVLKYDVYLESDSSTELTIALFDNFYVDQYETNVWHTIEIPLYYVLEHWDKLADPDVALDYNNRYAAGTVLTFSQDAGSSYAKAYVGNFSLTYSTENISVEEKEGSEDYEFLAGENYDLLDIFEAKIEDAAADIIRIEAGKNDVFEELEAGIFSPEEAGEYTLRFYVRKGGAVGIAEESIIVL